MSSTRSARGVIDGAQDRGLRLFANSLEAFLERHVVDEYGAWREAGRLPAELLHQAAGDGFLAMSAAEEHGGLDVQDPRYGLLTVQEAMLAGAPALALAFIAVNCVVAPAIGRAGSEDLAARHLPALTAGESLAAVITGDISFRDDRVTGSARFVPGGDALGVILAVGRDSDGHLRAGLVDVGDVAPVPSDLGIGLSEAGMVDIRLDSAPARYLESVDDVLADLWLAHAVAAVAAADAALGLAVEYVSSRSAFGQPIASFQNTRDVLGDLAADLSAAQALVSTLVTEAGEGRLSPGRAAAAQRHSARLASQAVDVGLQLHGGYGYMMEYPISHAYADAAYWRVAPGVTLAREFAADQALRRG